MKFATMLVICSALLVANPGAQSKAADPLTGTWTGTLGPSETQQQSIKMDMKYDGKTITGVITGPRIPADITQGTFDEATGALKLDAILRNDNKTAVVFEGKVEKGAASGSVAFDGQSGIFSVTKDAPPK